MTITNEETEARTKVSQEEEATHTQTKCLWSIPKDAKKNRIYKDFIRANGLIYDIKSSGNETYSFIDWKEPNCWNIFIKGPNDSPYENKFFLLEIIFSVRQYPFECPTYRFLTPMYHKNVNWDDIDPFNGGQMFTDHTAWSPASSAADYVLSIGGMLNSSSPDFACVNDDCSEHLAKYYASIFGLDEPEFGGAMPMLAEVATISDVLAEPATQEQRTSILPDEEAVAIPALPVSDEEVVMPSSPASSTWSILEMGTASAG